MENLKRILSFIIVFIFLLFTVQYNTYAQQNSTIQTPIKVAVFLSNFNSPFISNLKTDLENIQKENNIQFTFFDSKANEVIQNENIEKSINGNFNFYVVDLVNSSSNLSKDALTRLFNTNVPVIFILIPNNEILSFIKTYNRAIIIGADDSEAGTLQGKILTDIWNSNKESFDRNKDNIMQYIMLLGPANDPSTPLRTKGSIQSLKNNGIQTQELASVTCKWDKECSRISMESLFLVFDGKIEAIISNNDAMAIGAIETLQKYGYNKGDKSKYIPVVGVDAIPEAQELIKQGIMTGTVVQNTRAYANAIYAVGKNMISSNNPLSETDYTFDETGKIIKLPYYIYTP